MFSRELEVIARALAGIAFLLITAPIGAHLLGRAGCASKFRCGPARKAMLLKVSTIASGMFSTGLSRTSKSAETAIARGSAGTCSPMPTRSRHQIETA